MYRNHRNLGAFRNFFKLHAMPKKTQYYCQKSSDDVLDETYFARLVELLEYNDEILLAYTNETDCPNSQCDYMEDDLEERALKMIRNFTYGGLWYGICRSSVWDMILPEQNLQGNDHVIAFNLALVGKIGYIDEYLYRRNVVVERTRESYRDFCKQTVFSNADMYPDIKLLEMFYGHMNVINSSTEIDDKDGFTKCVVDEIFRRFGVESLHNDYIVLKKSYYYLLFSAAAVNGKESQIMKRKVFLEELEFYLNKNWRFRCYCFSRVCKLFYKLCKKLW